MLIVFTSNDLIRLYGRDSQKIADYIAKQIPGTKQFLVDGKWEDSPEGKVTEVSYRFGTLLPQVRNVASTWNYIQQNSIQPVEYPLQTMRKLSDARFGNNNINFFCPWGPRYNASDFNVQEEDQEVSTLREIGDVMMEFKANGYSPTVMIMPADLYGTEVNGLNPDFVKEYFASLAETAQRELESSATLEILPWSQIRGDNKDRYNELLKQVQEDFESYVKPSEFSRAIKTAEYFNPEKPVESAMDYCLERVVEGIIVAEEFDPLKLSLVKKEKDTLDGPLKRLYVIPECKRAPWLGGVWR